MILSQRSAARQEVARRFGPEAVIDPREEDRGGSADRAQGRVILFGGLPKADPMTTLDGNRIHYGEIEVVGAFSYYRSYHERALDAIRRGLVPVEQMVTHTLLLEEVAQAFEIADSGEGLKVMVTP